MAWTFTVRRKVQNVEFPSHFIDFSNIYTLVWLLSPAGLCNSWETENGTPSSVITVEQALITVIQPEATKAAGSHQKEKITQLKVLQQITKQYCNLKNTLVLSELLVRYWWNLIKSSDCNLSLKYLVYYEDPVLWGSVSFFISLQANCLYLAFSSCWSPGRSAPLFSLIKLQMWNTAK